MAFVHADFLLQSDTASRLYHSYAENEPVLDYHCHLPARQIAENRPFRDLTEIWLEGDHYKWRAMRANGVAERYCTGDASPREKFLAWSQTVPFTLRNPLYHWTHLELQRYFGISELLDANSAARMWEEANRQLSRSELSPQSILRKFHVRALCTTDDPTDSLQYHEQLKKSGLPISVFPAFRPDRAIRIEDPGAFNEWIAQLEKCTNINVRTFGDFLDALRTRHEDFHAHGCRLSDHGLDVCPSEDCGDAQAEHIFVSVRSGSPPGRLEPLKFGSYMMRFFGRLDAAKGWTKQLHVGALRSTNARMLKTSGRDTGFDSIADWPQVESLVRYLDQLDQEQQLPRVIVYNLNPADNYAFATAVGNFQDGTIPGKIQLGSGWWFLDQKEAIEWQLNALSNCGLLSRFVGMTTDSRSFMSFPRHEYFRRVLCNLIGNEIEAGLLPGSDELLGGMIRSICFENARAYFALPGVHHSAATLVDSSAH